MVWIVLVKVKFNLFLYIDENPTTDLISKVNIGFPKLRAPRKLLRERLKHLKEQKNDVEFEKIARSGKRK